MSAFVLKMFALITMMIDHVGAVFMADFPYILRCIGRAAFPIYVFLISEGCKYTKNIWKYMLRLATFALVSQIPFNLCFSQTRLGVKISFVNDTNVFYTLLLGVLAIAEFQILKQWVEAIEVKIPNPWISKAYIILRYLPACVPALGCVFLADYLSTDYGSFGVMWIFIMYLCGNKWLKVGCAFFGVMYRYGQRVFNQFVQCVIDLDFSSISRQYNLMRYDYLRLGFALAAVLLIVLYNGKRGKNLKLSFYAAYPMHLLILGVLLMVLK